MANMTILEPKQVVMSLFDAFGKGDMQAIRNLLSDDIDWLVPGDPEKMPWAGRLHGPDAVLKGMSGNVGATENLQITTKWMLSDGDKVVMLINEKAKVPKTGRSYDVDSVHIYTVKDGQIVRFENHFNPLPLVEATFGDVTFGDGSEERTHRIVEEEWVFLMGNECHHYETFTYEYDENGLRVRGKLDNPARGVSYIMSYKYDENGKGTGEEWVNSADEKDIYTITYEYDEDGSRVIGGEAVGGNSWNFAYEYDEKGRKTKMTNKYSNGNSWVFTYRYGENGKCILGQGNATSGLRCTITYAYEDD